MKQLLENLIAGTWNRLAAPTPPLVRSGALDFGAEVVDGELSRRRVSIPQQKRPEHLAILGKTGQGKSYLLRYLASQDIEADRGFIYFDLHGDTTFFLLRRIAHEERRRRADLSTKLVVVEPADAVWSVGLNVLEHRPGEQIFVQIAEFADILKRRWGLDHLGPRTDELLRNTLHLLSDNHLTLLETTTLLTNEAFRGVCLRRATNPEVQAYFRTRFDQASEAMQAVLRDAILNKVSGFTTDPRFRHILGQRRSTISLPDALDSGYWVILNLDKGRLGEQAITLGSLLLTKLKNALFSRRNRHLITIYADEVQNLTSFGGLETLFSEARKFATGVVSANQFMEQFTPEMRAAILSVGTHATFQLSPSDSEKIASAFDGGKRLAELLRNLPKRHLVLKSGHKRWQQAMVPTVEDTRVDFADLYNRCRARWARRRVDVEAEIRARQEDAGRGADEVLNEWE